MIQRYYSDDNRDRDNTFFQFLRNQLWLSLQMQKKYEDEEYDEEEVEQEYGGMEL